MACLGPCPSARKDRKYLPEGKIYLSRTGTFSSPFEGRSVNRAVSNVERLSKIRAGIKFIYFCDWLQCILTDKHAMFDCQFRTCSFFSRCNAREYIFNRQNSPTYFILARHSFIQSNRSHASNSDSLHVHVFGLRPVCTINFSRDQSSDKLINFLDSRLDP